MLDIKRRTTRALKHICTQVSRIEIFRRISLDFLLTVHNEKKIPFHIACKEKQFDVVEHDDE